METLKKYMSNLEDIRLLEIINIDYDEYTEEAIKAAKEELISRGINNFQVSKKSMLDNDYTEYITFKELISQVKFKDVFKKLRTLYNIDKSLSSHYKNIFNELLLVDSSNCNNIIILVQETENIFDPLVKEWQVIGQDIKNEEVFEIDYLEWKDWMSSLVKKSLIKMIGKDCYVAHCLYCMTKHGLSQEEVSKNFDNMEIKQVGDEAILDNQIIDFKCECEEVHPWLRFWARKIDYSVFSYIIFLIIPLLPKEVARKLFPIRGVIGLTPIIWIFIESLLISKTGTTLGKWLFSIKIKKNTDKLLSYKDSFYRSSLVWVVGLGLGVRFVQVVTQIIAYIKLVDEGKSVWDKKVDSKIVYGQIKKWKIAIATFILIIIPVFEIIIYNNKY